MRELDPDVREALILALRALTDGMEDVPTGMLKPRCAKMRAEAKRAIRRVLHTRSGMAAGGSVSFSILCDLTSASGHASFEVI